jgi:transcriptional regulator with XRE-family HTH domain
MPTTAIASRLREARQRKHWTRVRLFVESGVHFNTIADIENGRNQQPSFEKVVRLARALGLQPEQLCPVPDVPEERINGERRACGDKRGVLMGGSVVGDGGVEDVSHSTRF